MASKPTIVLVPGAWHNASHFESLITRLEKAGYEVKALSIPSAGINGCEPSNLGDNTPDVDLISFTIRTAADAGKDIVVVMHSAGGVTGSDATKGLSKSERQAAGQPGGVTRLCYITAFALPEGPGIYNDQMPPAPWISLGPKSDSPRPATINPSTCKSTLPKDPFANFYHDCDPTEAKKAAAGIGRHSFAAKWTPVRYAAWKHIPSSYLICEDDRAIPVAVQEMWTKQEGNLFDVVERCSSAHSPFISMPDFTAEVVKRAAGEKI